jgi:hypothetical protein
MATTKCFIYRNPTFCFNHWKKCLTKKVCPIWLTTLINCHHGHCYFLLTLLAKEQHHTKRCYVSIEKTHKNLLLMKCFQSNFKHYNVGCLHALHPPHVLWFLALFLLYVSFPSQGSCATSIAHATIVHFFEQLSMQTHKKFNQHHNMFNSYENIQQPNYMKIFSRATNYHDVVNHVKPHLHSILKLLAKNPL